MLGHATISITLDLYSHALPNIQKDAMGALDRLLGTDNWRWCQMRLSRPNEESGTSRKCR
jgi:hypothetical protein